MSCFCHSHPTCCSLVKVRKATVCYTQRCGSFSKGSFPASGGNPMAQSKKLPTVRSNTLSGQLFMILICFNILHKKVKVRSYTALYPVCKSAQSMNIIIHPLVDLFIPRPTWLLWEAVSYSAITAQTLFTHISTIVYSQVLIYSWVNRGIVESTKMPSKLSKRQQNGLIESGLPWLRVLCSTADLQRSYSVHTYLLIWAVTYIL